MNLLAKYEILELRKSVRSEKSEIHINFRGFVRTGSTGSVEPVNLKIWGLEPVDFVGLHSRLWDCNPWIFRVLILIMGTHDYEFLTKPLNFEALV